MHMISNRVLPTAARYVSVLLAALLVYYLIREPFNVAVSDVLLPKIESLRAAGWGRFQHDSLLAGTSENPPPGGLAGAAEDIREKDAQAPIGDGSNGVGYVKKYKPDPVPYSPILDHFAWITYANFPPPVLENNAPPNPRVEEATPLLIGFTNNWPLLLQCVSSYIAAGWPPEDIHVVENTGTFLANRQQQLEIQNPFFLNHTALGILGVKVLATPTLLTFSQLQNFYLNLALEHDWQYFWWSHMDVLAMSDEDVKKNDRDHDWDHDPYATLYERSVGLLRYLNGPDMPPWATHFFSYDHLALVHRDAYLEAGGWDTQIPYGAADCDMYLRLHWAGYWQPQSEAGLVFDVDLALDDIAALFRVPGAHAAFRGDPVYAESGAGSSATERAHREAELKREQDMWPWVDKEGETFAHLVEVASRMQEHKWASASAPDHGAARRWQAGRQTGGRDDPFYRDPDGFAAAADILVDAGRRVFADKWGHRGCDLLAMGIEGKDAWRLERDWDVRESPGGIGGNWGKDWMMGAR
ncbi:hypothetical protein GGR52DRAFT_50904 [Hypoxylon sp. FL1284]|nr:hypothetical protein GGR52DRAFT_50904 [Hypoxylon sp. FL1284]